MRKSAPILGRQCYVDPETCGTPKGGPVSVDGVTTIAGIAAEAGVSVPTVSKVLNGRPDVSVATRARVESVIERHQYRRRRARTGSRPRLIDLVIHEPGPGAGA